MTSEPPAPPATSPSPPVAVRLPVTPIRITYGLLGVLGVIFVIQVWFNPFGAGIDPVIEWGAKDNVLIAQGQIWRLFTSMFIHGSLLHFAFNAYALYNIGRQLEAVYGGTRFTLLYILGGLMGSVFSLWLNPHPSIGASGAIFALLGAEAVLLYRNRALLGARGRSALQNIVVIAGVNLMLGLQGGIDNWAHLGGLVGGLSLAWWVGPVWGVDRPPFATPVIADQNPLTPGRWAGVALFGVGLLALTAGAVVVQLVR